jgi:hypothetical protein
MDQMEPSPPTKSTISLIFTLLLVSLFVLTIWACPSPVKRGRMGNIEILHSFPVRW